MARLKQFSQYLNPVPQFNAFSQEAGIQSALGSDRGSNIRESSRLRAANYKAGSSGWRLTPTGIEGTVIQIIKSFTTGEAIVLGDAVILGVFYTADLELSSSQYFNITDAAQTGLDILGDITIEALIKLESAPGTDVTFDIASKWQDTGNQRSWRFLYHDVSGTPQLELAVSADGNTSESLKIVKTLATGTWFHVAVAWDASASSAEFYVDGVSIGTDTGAITALHDSTEDFRIGAEGSGGGVGRFFDGRMADIRVFDDLRTDAEILANWDIPLEPTNESNLKGYWRGKNDGSDGMLDETANDNDLTGNATPTFATDDTACPVFYFNDASPTLWKSDSLFRSHFETTIGIAQETIGSGKTALVIVGDVVIGLSGLTPFRPYYITDTRGIIGLIPGTNTRQIASSLSATEFLVVNAV